MNCSLIKDEGIVSQSVDILRKGGVIIYPTETFYGLGADAFNRSAVSSVFQLKGRESEKTLPLIISDRKILESVCVDINQTALKLMDAFWPGPLTILFKVKKTLPKGVVSIDNKTAVRISSNPVATKIAEFLGGPITATSANLSGYKSPRTISEISEELKRSVDFILDSGELEGMKGSTIVDTTVSPLKIIREGEIPSEKIYSLV